MLFLTRYQARRALQSTLILRIDPRSVGWHSGSNQPFTIAGRNMLAWLEEKAPILRSPIRLANKTLYSIEPFLLPPCVFKGMMPVEKEPRYQLLEDLIRHRSDVTGSNWYADLVRTLAREGVARHKKIILTDETAIRNFCHGYGLDMIRTMEAHGYDDSRAADLGTAFIDKNGKICKSDAGNHRFAAARILGVARMPLEILGVHREWFQKVAPSGKLVDLQSALKIVEEDHQSPLPLIS